MTIGVPKESAPGETRTAMVPANVARLKLLWTIETGNDPRALHGLMPVLVVGRLSRPSGSREVASSAAA